MNIQEAIKLLKEIRYFETDGTANLWDMDMLEEAILTIEEHIDALEKHIFPEEENNA